MSEPIDEMSDKQTPTDTMSVENASSEHESTCRCSYCYYRREKTDVQK